MVCPFTPRDYDLLSYEIHSEEEYESVLFLLSVEKIYNKDNIQKG